MVINMRMDAPLNPKASEKSPLWGFLRARRIISRYFSNREDGHWDNAGVEPRSGVSV